MAFPSVASSSTSSGNSSGISVTLPSGVTTGDLLILIAGFDGAGGTETQDPDIFVVQAGWTREVLHHADRVCSGAVFWKVATGSDAATVDLENNALAEVGNIIALRITGHGGEVEAVVTDNFTEGFSVSDAPNPPSLSPTWGAADTLWVAAAVVDNGTRTYTADPSGYSGGVELGSTSAGVVVRSVTKAASASSEDPGAFTLNEVDQWVVFTIAIKPAGGGGVSVALTGNSSTSAVGTLGVSAGASVSVTPTGVASSSTVGTLGVTAEINASAELAGVASTSAVGTLTAEVGGGTTAVLSGVAGTSAVGTLTAAGQVNEFVDLLGNSATGAVGTLIVVTGLQVALTGNAATGAVGTLGVTAEINASAMLTGVGSSGAVGTLEVTVPITASVELTGVGATGTIGTLTAVGAGQIWTEVPATSTTWTEIS